MELGPGGQRWVEQLAAQYGMPRTEVIRIAMAIAKAHEREFRGLLELRGTPQPTQDPLAPNPRGKKRQKAADPGA